MLLRIKYQKLLPVLGGHFPPDISLDQLLLALHEPDQSLVLPSGSVLVQPGVRPLGVIELTRNVPVLLNHQGLGCLSSLLPPLLLLDNVEL